MLPMPPGDPGQRARRPDAGGDRRNVEQTAPAVVDTRPRYTTIAAAPPTYQTSPSSERVSVDGTARWRGEPTPALDRDPTDDVGLPFCAFPVRVNADQRLTATGEQGVLVVCWTQTVTIALLLDRLGAWQW